MVLIIVAAATDNFLLLEPTELRSAMVRLAKAGRRPCHRSRHLLRSGSSDP